MTVLAVEISDVRCYLSSSMTEPTTLLVASALAVVAPLITRISSLVFYWGKQKITIESMGNVLEIDREADSENLAALRKVIREEKRE